MGAKEAFVPESDMDAAMQVGTAGLGKAFKIGKKIQSLFN
jgi:hypothetical protein